MKAGVAAATLLVTLSASLSADGEGARLGAGIAFVRLGGRRATGGWSPQASVELPIARVGGVAFSYLNALSLFNFSAVRWLGVIDQNALLVSVGGGRYRLSAGPAVEVMSVPLCDDEGLCGRSSGFAPGVIGSFSAAYEETGKGLGGAIVGTGRYVPAPIWSGVAFSIAAMGTFSW